MTKVKSELISDVIEMAEKWLNTDEGVGSGHDIQPVDFIRFVNAELTPYLTKVLRNNKVVKKIIKLLKKRQSYHSTNRQDCEETSLKKIRFIC
ncbi:hypothetical protein COF51_05235 [Bacillus pseudomycoides]|uniref:hypothetical protein n=1 Tax=Bacillus pseudomycoides TaxID=64104 RepID=UPI000BFD6E85|nr:hypothetical protein [Bacillus pseudomycoides]PHE40070.1 hypothetical protein COF51_05235 [Bacillus pseudomycoides]